jgi:hypothetical protein
VVLDDVAGLGRLERAAVLAGVLCEHLVAKHLWQGLGQEPLARIDATRRRARAMWSWSTTLDVVPSWFWRWTQSLLASFGDLEQIVGHPEIAHLARTRVTRREWVRVCAR